MTSFETRNLTEAEIKFTRFSVLASFRDVQTIEIAESGEARIVMRFPLHYVNPEAIVRNTLERWQSAKNIQTERDGELVTVRCMFRPVSDEN